MLLAAITDSYLRVVVKVSNTVCLAGWESQSYCSYIAVTLALDCSSLQTVPRQAAALRSFAFSWGFVSFIEVWAATACSAARWNSSSSLDIACTGPRRRLHLRILSGYQANSCTDFVSLSLWLLSAAPLTSKDHSGSESAFGRSGSLASPAPSLFAFLLFASQASTSSASSPRDHSFLIMSLFYLVCFFSSELAA